MLYTASFYVAQSSLFGMLLTTTNLEVHSVEGVSHDDDHLPALPYSKISLPALKVRNPAPRMEWEIEGKDCIAESIQAGAKGESMLG